MVAEIPLTGYPPGQIPARAGGRHRAVSYAPAGRGRDFSRAQNHRSTTQANERIDPDRAGGAPDIAAGAGMIHASRAVAAPLRVEEAAVKTSFARGCPTRTPLFKLAAFAAMAVLSPASARAGEVTSRVRALTRPACGFGCSQSEGTHLGLDRGA